MKPFPQFQQLPLELQRQIWAFALQDEPAAPVCLFDTNNGRPSPSVDLEVHALMHVCRESRILAFSHFQFQYRQKACFGSTCAFNESSDNSSSSQQKRLDYEILYVPGHQFPDYFSFPQALELRHLAADESLLFISEFQTRFAVLLSRLPRLRTLSILFVQEVNPSAQQRYRLRDVGEGEMVWASQTGMMARIDAWEFVRRFCEGLAAVERRGLAGVYGLRSHDHGDGGCLRLRFDVVPRLVVPKRYGILAAVYWWSSALRLVDLVARSVSAVVTRVT